MSLRFSGGQVLQRGRGIGGLLRLMKSVFAPVVKSVSRGVVSAAKSEGGKKLLNVLKEQAVNSSMNIAADTLRGVDLKDSFKKEAKSLKKNVATTIDDFQNSRKRAYLSQSGKGVGKVVKKQSLKKPRLAYSKRDFFD